MNGLYLVINKKRNLLYSWWCSYKTTYLTIHDTLHCININCHTQHINTHENITSYFLPNYVRGTNGKVAKIHSRQ